ncbi:MAG: hypothetical protein M3N39_01280 [Pseudomonadota bacterium]|nr:hypothetical protein [Pseudomonadota bacterium]
MFSRQLALGASLIALSTDMASAQTTFSGTNRSTVNDNGVNNQATASHDSSVR